MVGGGGWEWEWWWGISNPAYYTPGLYHYAYIHVLVCIERILGHLRDLLAPLRDFLPNDQGLVKLLKVGPRWSEPSDIGCTKL